MAIHIQYLTTCIGELIIGSFGDALCLLDYKDRLKREAVDARLQKGLSAEYKLGSTPILQAAERQLSEYFAGDRQDFELPLITVGSDFQKSVWQALLKIPYGCTSSYLALAEQIGNPKAVRAVANANGANAIAVMIPCHRIIGSNGGLVGYAGGLAAKQKLLDIESIYPNKLTTGVTLNVLA